MNNTDKSMEKINYTKLLMFLAIFIVITLVLLLTLIVPNIKEYRTARGQYNNASVHKIRVQSVLAERENDLKELQSKNRKVFEAFKHKFTQDEFIGFANNFFDKVTLKEVKQSDYKKEFKVYELNVTSSLKTPVNFYKFLEGLNHYQNMIQADFPIELISNGDIINSSFKIRVYKPLKK